MMMMLHNPALLREQCTSLYFYVFFWGGGGGRGGIHFCFAIIKGFRLLCPPDRHPYHNMNTTFYRSCLMDDIVILCSIVVLLLCSIIGRHVGSGGLPVGLCN